MDQQQAAEVLRNVDQRTKRIEQILPDLPTRDEMREAIDRSIKAAVAPLATRQEMREAIQAATEPLATKEELARAVAPLATKEELLAVKQELKGTLVEWRDELRRHMDVWAERIGDHVKLAFEAIQSVDGKHTRNYTELRESLVELRRTEAQHHAALLKNFDELRGYWRDDMKAHAKEHLKITKSIDNVRARVEKIEAKAPRRRKAS